MYMLCATGAWRGWSLWAVDLGLAVYYTEATPGIFRLNRRALPPLVMKFIIRLWMPLNCLRLCALSTFEFYAVCVCADDVCIPRRLVLGCGWDAVTFSIGCTSCAEWFLTTLVILHLYCGLLQDYRMALKWLMIDWWRLSWISCSKVSIPFRAAPCIFLCWELDIVLRLKDV